jgi:hypothetical protein
MEVNEMREYYQYSKKHFEYMMRGILINNKLGFMEDITKAWREEGNTTWEYIYRISTKNSAVDIIVFSSVDMNIDKVREIGGDAVRVVLRWKTKNGNVYKHVAKHYRIKTLFDNLKDTLVGIQFGDVKAPEGWMVEI